MQREPGHLLDEADIGSGEKQPGERETEQEVRKVHNPKMDKTSDSANKEKESAGKSRDQSSKKD
jgi:hypothetical protein